MAYQIRQREPLFDRATQDVLERRAKELLGLALLAVGSVLVLALVSYSPSDPSFLGTTSEAPANLLGHFGAYLAAPLYVILGVGAWALAAVCLAWGLRFLLHLGQERALTRLIFAPIAIAVCSVYAATHPPGQEWGHSFGLGGLFGDTALGVLLGVLPVDPVLGLKVSAVGLALIMVALGLYCLGFSWSELRRTGRYLWLSVLMAFDRIMVGLGRAGAKTAANAAAFRHRRAENRASRDLADDDTDDARYDDDDDAFGDDDDPEPRRRFRVFGMFRRNRADDNDAAYDEDDGLGDQLREGGETRVRDRIADVVRERMGPERIEPPLRREPSLQGLLPDPDLPLSDPMDTTLPDAEPFDPGDDDGVYDFGDSDRFADRLAPAIPRASEARPVVQHSVRRNVPSKQAQAEAQPALRFDTDAEEDVYQTPPLSLLSDPAGVEKTYLSDEALEENARMLENVLEDYGVKGDIVSVRPGPVVTMYELEPAPGLKASRVIGLADDIARSMSALSARVSTVPGRSVIGIELPNEAREIVLLREILGARDFGDSKLRLPLALGKDISGEPVVANLAKMPHLLIAGTTGSGKSVAINTMILSLLYKLTPDECRLIMIDPKMLELSVYDGIPHLLSPVVTDPKKAVVALKWVVGEMEERYRKMSKMGVRNIEGYNGRVRETLSKGEMFSRTFQTGFDDETGDPIFETEEFEPEALPYIVVIVDEMADLMMVAGKEIEACIQRLAQMARASGIHLIMATQRPSVDVITGTIKANFPTRISFQVTSKVDSRTILGEQGAEQLLGMGDMLYMAGGGRIVRVHGPFVSDEEVEEVVTHLKAFGPPDYVGNVVDGPDEEKADSIDLVLGLGGNTNGEDALYDQAVQIAIRDRKCSTSYIQRKLAIGYNKAARLVEQMEDQGIVSAANHVGKREVLIPAPE
ncbi:MAG: DNA translocase FtsK 4TM domain-containing protein [Pseudomonadota bacterium]